MPSQFREFARVFESFQEKFPKHPLLEELRNRLCRGKFPPDSWLQSKTAKMNQLIAPTWSQADHEDRDLAS